MNFVFNKLFCYADAYDGNILNERLRVRLARRGYQVSIKVGNYPQMFSHAVDFVVL